MENNKGWCTFPDETFLEEMETKVVPFLKENVQEGTCTGWDGTQLHYYYANRENAKGSMVLSHGFCEFFGKYHELCYYFYEQGYSFYFLEHRGHGYSGRKLDEWDKVYVEDYSDYVKDLKCFLDQVVLPVMAEKGESAKNLFLYAHSMGGAIGALFLEEYPHYFAGAVLSSPLMELNLGKYPKLVVQLLLLRAKLLHLETEYVPGQKGFDGVRMFAGSCAMSKPRYEYTFRMRENDFHNQTYGGCYSWTGASIRATRRLQKNAAKVTVPVLLFQAGRDTMVKKHGQDIFCQRAKHVQCVYLEESKHEIFNGTAEIREAYYEKLFAFLDANRSK